MPSFDPGLSFDGILIILTAIAIVGLVVWLFGGWRK